MRVRRLIVIAAACWQSAESFTTAYDDNIRYRKALIDEYADSWAYEFIDFWCDRPAYASSVA